MAWSTPSNQSTGDLITASIWNQNVVANPIALTPLGLSWYFTGGGAPPDTGVAGYIEIPFKCDIERATMLANVSGSMVVDIWKDTYVNYPPVDADSITASAPPTLSSAIKSQDVTLTGWTKAITAGDILGFNVDSASTLSFCTLSLKLNKS